MADMTPRERFARLFRREPLDTMPFFSGMGMVLMPAIKQLGYRFPQVHRDPEKLARSAILSSKMFGFDSVVVPFDMCWESQALGNKISLYENSEDILYPTIPKKPLEVHGRGGNPGQHRRAVSDFSDPRGHKDRQERAARVPHRRYVLGPLVGGSLSALLFIRVFQPLMAKKTQGCGCAQDGP